jgi:4-pyridoxolactonase
VINSHYHFDHCGGNKHFKTACTICHAKELEVCGCPQPFEHFGYSDLSFAPEIARKNGKTLPPDPALDMYTPTFQTLQGDQEIAKGMWLFETPGHTAGHYSMMVELAHRRPMLFTADACYSKKNLELMCISSFHLDPVANLHSMQRLKDLAEKYDAELFFSHDAESFATYMKGANFYS